MASQNPEDLRRRAERYEQIAQRMTDQQAVQALHDLAQDYINQADQVEATRAIAAASPRDA